MTVMNEAQESPALAAARGKIVAAFRSLPADAHTEVEAQMLSALAHAQLHNDSTAVRMFIDHLLFTAEMYSRGYRPADPETANEDAGAMAAEDVVSMLRHSRGAGE